MSARLTATSSLLHNNLVHSPGGYLASAHNSVTASGGKVLLHNLSTGESKDGPEITQCMSVRYLQLAIGTVLCISSTNGTMIYSEDGTTCLVFVPLSCGAKEADVLTHHQGACVVPTTQHIIIGMSTGSLIPVQAAALDQFAVLGECPNQSPAAEVADVCFSSVANSDQGGVVSAHNTGELRVWGSTGSSYTETLVVPPAGLAPVRIEAMGPRVMVAFGPGTICLYDARSWELQVEITAHPRWMNAISVRDEVIASVGEDTVLNIWHVDTASGQIGLQHSSSVTDTLLTGVALVGTTATVTAYDSDEIYTVYF